MPEKNENKPQVTTTDNNNQPNSASWPTVNTSTSENVNRLNINKSDEFHSISKDYFIEKK